jgi:hypothetical protein
MSENPIDHLPAIAMSANGDRQDTGCFYYGSLPLEKAQTLRKCGARIRKKMGQAISSIIDIGCELIAAKKALGHGAFGDWVESECGFTMRTAQNYMKASRLAHKYESVSYLSAATLYRMCSRRIPAELLHKVIEHASHGDRVTEADFDRMCMELKKSKVRVVRAYAEDTGKDMRISELNKRNSPVQLAEDNSFAERAEQDARWIVKHIGEVAAFNLIVMSNGGTLVGALQLVKRRIVERGAQSRPLFSDVNET